jgi:hypothetical protein
MNSVSVSKAADSCSFSIVNSRSEVIPNFATADSQDARRSAYPPISQSVMGLGINDQ